MHDLLTNIQNKIMKKNFFKDLQSRKAIAKQLAQNAKDFGYIDEQRMNEIITKT